MTAKIYGIANCDQVRKARAWFAEHSIAVEFHDFKKHGINEGLIQRWLQHVPWQSLINKRGASWRGLTDEDRAGLVDQTSALALMLKTPTLIKRPIVEIDDRLIVGYFPALYPQPLPLAPTP